LIRFEELELEPDGRGERRRDEARPFCLLDRTARSGAVNSGTNPETCPKNNLGEPGYPVDPVDRSLGVYLGVYLAFQELDAGRSRGPAQGEQEASLDRREQQVLGTPRIPRAVELEGRAVGSSGNPSAARTAWPLAPPVSRAV
jgi:hypothetical protein